MLRGIFIIFVVSNDEKEAYFIESIKNKKHWISNTIFVFYKDFQWKKTLNFIVYELASSKADLKRWVLIQLTYSMR